MSGFVFAVAVVAAVPLYLARGRQWFFLDDWDFLAHRKLTSAHDLFLPHNEHWSTVPIIVYRVLWSVVGLRYWPYELVAIALHLTAAFLLRKIMLRSGVDVWIATVAALLFVSLGSGKQDIVWAFQIGFVGSLVCGLGHLILADHDGPSDRRDVIGLGIGVVGLMCSGVAVTMTIIVGLAVLLRRGWRPALLNTVPLAAIYGVWFAIIGHEGYAKHHATAGDLRSYVQTAISSAFSHMGQVWGVGAILGIVIVVGLVLAWRTLSHQDFRALAAAPLALLIGAVVFSLVSGYGRVFLGVDEATASRYTHLIAAMALPAIAFALDTLARRWRVLYPLAIVLLLIGIPGNIAAISPNKADHFLLGNEQLVEALAHSPYVDRVPPSVIAVNPDYSVIAPTLTATAGWLVDGVKSGRIPKPSPNTPALAASATLILVLDARAAPATTHACRLLTNPITVTADTGDVYVFRNGKVAVHVPFGNGALSQPVVFSPNSAVAIRGGPVRLAFTAGARGASPELCRG